MDRRQFLGAAIGSTVLGKVATGTTPSPKGDKAHEAGEIEIGGQKYKVFNIPKSYTFTYKDNHYVSLLMWTPLRADVGHTTSPLSCMGEIGTYKGLRDCVHNMNCISDDFVKSRFVLHCRETGQAILIRSSHKYVEVLPATTRIQIQEGECCKGDCCV